MINLFFSGIVDLKTQNFIAKDTKINLHKSLFDNSENDPRLNGVSSIKNENIVTINKGVFTAVKIGYLSSMVNPSR